MRGEWGAPSSGTQVLIPLLSVSQEQEWLQTTPCCVFTISAATDPSDRRRLFQSVNQSVAITPPQLDLVTLYFIFFSFFFPFGFFRSFFQPVSRIRALCKLHSVTGPTYLPTGALVKGREPSTKRNYLPALTLPLLFIFFNNPFLLFLLFLFRSRLDYSPSPPPFLAEAPPILSFKHLKYGSQTASIAKPLPRFKLFQQVHLSATKRCLSVCCPTALVWCLCAAARCHISGVAPPFSPPPPDLCLSSPIPLFCRHHRNLPRILLHYCPTLSIRYPLLFPLKYSICTYSLIEFICLLSSPCRFLLFCDC